MPVLQKRELRLTGITCRRRRRTNHIRVSSFLAVRILIVAYKGVRDGDAESLGDDRRSLTLIASHWRTRRGVLAIDVAGSREQGSAKEDALQRQIFPHWFSFNE